MELIIDFNLENSLLLLEPLSISRHARELQNYAINEPTIWQYSMINPGGSTTAMDAYIALAQKERLQNKAYTFIVKEKATGTIVGSSRYYDIDFQHQYCTIGYTWFGKSYRKNGFNRNCKLLMLTHAFENWKMERIEFRADINNTASINAMKAIGCVQEGILRSHANTHSGTRRTSIILSILKEEWHNSVKQLLTSKIY